MMAVLDLKLIFLTFAILGLSYHTEVNYFSDEFAIYAERSYNVCRKGLYAVVTKPILVDKWVDWFLLFVPADDKILRVGKVFKAVLENGVILFKVTDIDEGSYLALESNVLLRPRLEIKFFEMAPAPANHTFNRHKRHSLSRLQVRLIFRRPSALFQYSVGIPIRKYMEIELQRFLENLEEVMVWLAKYSNRFNYGSDHCLII